MRRIAKFTAVVSLTAYLCACTPAVVIPDEGTYACRVRVEEKFLAVELKSNPLSNPMGGVTGAGAGAVLGAVGSLFLLPLVILTVPISAIAGAGYGTACAAASMERPGAEADFARIVRAADTSGLKRALAANLDAAWAGAGCSRAVKAGATPDITVEIDRVEVTMGCAFGTQEYTVEVGWRALATTDRRPLEKYTTACHQDSTREVDAWFAAPERAQAEVEQVMARTGQRMAAQLLPWERLDLCRFKTGKSGEVEEK